MWGQDRVSDWIPRLALDGNEARAGSWIVHQGLYRTKCNQDEVRDWGHSVLIWERNGAGSGTGSQGRYCMKWGKDRLRDSPNNARTESGTGYQGGYLTK